MACHNNSSLRPLIIILLSRTRRLLPMAEEAHLHTKVRQVLLNPTRARLQQLEEALW